MNFHDFKKLFQQNFAKITRDADNLFEVEVDKDEMWNLYLDSFPAGTNEIYRKRREHDCSCCRHFIKTIGNAVVIKDNKIKTIWDFNTGDTTYQPVINALNNYVLSKSVSNVYVSKITRIGTDHNHEETEAGIKSWEHFCLDIPEKFVSRTGRSDGDIKGYFRDTKNVFKRSLDEITEDSITTVLELISSNSIYKGNEWKGVLESFLSYKREYLGVRDEDKENYAWVNSSKAGMSVGRIRNHSMGTLLVDISNGVELDTAVKKYETIVAPANYKRPKAIYTKRMLEEAQKTITELGYMDSLKRRFATLDDISVNNILFCNRDSAKRIAGADVFSEMMEEASQSSRKFSKVEEVNIEKFISDILPSVSSIEAYLENRHASNMMSLIAPFNRDAKTMFKWSNGFSWAYTGNLTDSDVKKNVKSAGGKVDGDLRFSIQWNENRQDNCDLDAHCKEADGFEIYFGSAKKPRFSSTAGQLDVDVIDPCYHTAVENITWANRKTMKPGKYKFFVNQYSGSAKNGFRAEIEFDGQIYSFDYSRSMRSGENVYVADVILDNEGNFRIESLLDSSVSSKDIWGVKTNKFVPVSTIMYSPNYWDEQQGIGNKHFFFMLNGCINPERPNGFYNEFLSSELEAHKRVLEALGGKMSVEDVEDQLSGIGFSSTIRNELIVKIKGSSERVIKIKF